MNSRQQRTERRVAQLMKKATKTPEELRELLSLTPDLLEDKIQEHSATKKEADELRRFINGIFPKGERHE